MVRHDTDLPFGDAFSPAQLHTDDDRTELSVVLEMAKEYEGQEDEFDEAIRETFFPTTTIRPEQRTSDSG